MLPGSSVRWFKHTSVSQTGFIFVLMGLTYLSTLRMDTKSVSLKCFVFELSDTVVNQ